MLRAVQYKVSKHLPIPRHGRALERVECLASQHDGRASYGVDPKERNANEEEGLESGGRRRWINPVTASAELLPSPMQNAFKYSATSSGQKRSFQALKKQFSPVIIVSELTGCGPLLLRGLPPTSDRRVTLHKGVLVPEKGLKMLCGGVVGCAMCLAASTYYVLNNGRQ